MIEIKNLQFSWRKQDKDLLDIADFSVKEGEKIFIQGASGSGKTTLLSLLGAVNSPTRGHISILGQNLSTMSLAQRDSFRADHMGFIFQMFNLIPYLSVLENVLLALKFSPKKSSKITQGMSAKEEALRLLNALGLQASNIKNQKVSELSVGQQQRVATARALIGSPELVIADEPTSALDHKARDSFLQLLFAECNKAGTTLIYVSHDETLGHLFDRQIPIEHFLAAKVNHEH